MVCGGGAKTILLPFRETRRPAGVTVHPERFVAPARVVAWKIVIGPLIWPPSRLVTFSDITVGSVNVPLTTTRSLLIPSVSHL